MNLQQKTKTDIWKWATLGASVLVILLGLAASWGTTQTRLDTQNARIKANCERVQDCEREVAALNVKIERAITLLETIREDVGTIKERQEALASVAREGDLP